MYSDDPIFLVAMCNHCGEWHHFKHDSSKFLQTDGLVCDHCKSSDFEPRSVRTERTFNHETAKRETAKVKRKIAKHGRL